MRKILVIQQKMIGDVLISSILCQNLKLIYPNTQIDYLINEHTYAVVKENPFIDNCILFKKDDEKNILSLYRFANKIKENDYDVVIDAYGKIQSNLISLLSRANNKISYHKWYSSWLYTYAITPDSFNKNAAIEDRLSLLQPLFKNTPVVKLVKQPTIYLSDKELQEAQSFLDKNGILPNENVYMVGVLGSGAEKTYPLDYMAKTLDFVAENTSGKFLFNYIPSQYEEAKNVYNLCKPKTQKRILLDAYTKSLRDFLNVLKYCKALIGNEGGAVNMAKALNVPTFSIYSPQISKQAWNTFSDEKNIGVHVLDYMKNNNLSNTELYAKFKPELFYSEILSFLEKI